MNGSTKEYHKSSYGIEMAGERAGGERGVRTTNEKSQAGMRARGRAYKMLGDVIKSGNWLRINIEHMRDQLSKRTASIHTTALVMSLRWTLGNL